MGRGIIHEPDDIREDNPPSNPELLAYLEKELVSSGYDLKPGNPELLAYLEKELVTSDYDLKHLKRLIFTSTTYQFS